MRGLFLAGVVLNALATYFNLVAMQSGVDKTGWLVVNGVCLLVCAIGAMSDDY